MALHPITAVTGTAVHVPGADIDTDRIIPARYLKCVTFDDLADKHFFDVRFDQDGHPSGHPLDDPRFAGASIMLTGPNFGCGSSREHAPQALSRSGFRALIGESFAEIFFGNATTLGMPCVSAARQDIETLAAFIENNPKAEVRIDLKTMTVSCAGIPVPVAMPDSARQALMSGRWDPIRELLDNEKMVAEVAEALPYL